MQDQNRQLPTRQDYFLVPLYDSNMSYRSYTTYMTYYGSG